MESHTWCSQTAADISPQTLNSAALSFVPLSHKIESVIPMNVYRSVNNSDQLQS